MRFGDPFDDRQAEAETAGGARPGFVGAIEPLEHMRGVFGRNADAVIGDSYPRAGFGDLQRSRNAPTWRRVANGVVEKVEHEAAQQMLIAAILQVRGRPALEREAACGG